MNHPPGRLTMPRVLLADRAFSYTKAVATNVQATWEREKRLQQQEAIEQQRAAQLAQPLLSGIQPQQLTPPKPSSHNCVNQPPNRW